MSVRSFTKCLFKALDDYVFCYVTLDRIVLRLFFENHMDMILNSYAYILR